MYIFIAYYIFCQNYSLYAESFFMVLISFALSIYSDQI